jgi:hypothetical protein
MLETVTNSWAFNLRITPKLVIGFKEECGATTETEAGSDSDEIETAAAGDGLNKEFTKSSCPTVRTGGFGGFPMHFEDPNFLISCINVFRAYNP